MQSTLADGQTRYETIGEAMLMRSEDQAEIKVTAIAEEDDDVVKDLKELVNVMTRNKEQIRPKANMVVAQIRKIAAVLL